MNKKIVYTDIVGDMLHFGHVNLFKNCKKLGDYLIIGVCSDELVATYKRKPILNLEERSKMIESIKCVDQIIKAPPCPITKQFILEHNIDIVVHANDMSQETLNNWYKAPIEMGRFQTVDYTKEISTSEIINRIKTRIENKTL
jgi:cytidyltransferase-like protein